MRNLIPALLSALTLVCALAADAGADDPYIPPSAGLSADVLLKAIDIPLTAENVKQAGLTEKQALAALDDPKSRRYTRMRALSALAFLPSDTARAAIERIAKADADEVVQEQAIITLARAFGPKDPKTVRGFLEFIAKQELTARVADRITAELKTLGALDPAAH